MADSDHSSTPGKSPAFQFYPKDFLTDEHVRLMSMQERGIYITLMSYCWIEGTLPFDEVRLARLCGQPLKQFQRLWKAIQPCFDPDPLNEARIIHPRLDKERVKQIVYKRRQSDYGKLGGRPTTPKQAKPLPDSKGYPFEKESQPPDGALGKTKGSERSSFAVCSLQSSDSSQKKTATADARSKHPVYRNGRFAVFDWQFEDLQQSLGPHFEDFLWDEWFQHLAEKLDAEKLAIDKRDLPAWIYGETMEEAKRRGIGLAAPITKAAARSDGITPESLAEGIRAARERGDFARQR